MGNSQLLFLGVSKICEIVIKVWVRTVVVYITDKYSLIMHSTPGNGDVH